MKNNRGFSVIEVLLVLVIIGLLAFAGWTVYKNNDSEENSNAQTGTTQQTAPVVESTEDLTEAEEFLETADVDAELDTSEIDEALAE